MALSLCRTALSPCFRRSDDRIHPNGSSRRLVQRHGSSAICSRASSLVGSQLLPLTSRTPLRQLRRRSWLRPLASSKADRNSPTQQKGSKQLLDEVEEDDPTPFYEPLLRSFVLGLGVGVIFESGHVALRFLGLLWEMGYHQTVDILPRVQEQFAPLFVPDHFAAVGAWFLFYTIEAAAIYSILRQHPDDKQAAEKALRNIRPLPKRMLPSRLQLLKSVLRVFKPLGLQPALAGSGSSSHRSFSSGNQFQPQLPQPSFEPPQSSAFIDDSSTATSPSPGTPSGSSSPDQGVQAANGLLVQPQGSPKDGVWAFVEEQEPEAVPQLQPEEEAAESVQTPNDLVLPKPLAKARQEKGLKPGAWDPSSMGKKIMQRNKELRDRSLYLKNMWYAVAASQDVKDKPVASELCGEKLVLWRGADGAVHCINDVCPHRGAPLSLGWVEKHNEQECVVCPYHGWAFDSKGVCQHVPAAENMADRPKQSITEAYSVVEKGGFVWLFYGSKRLPMEERPDIPFTPELEDPLWRPVYGEIEFDCPHWGVFENAIDMAHIHYLHGDSFGNKEQPQIRDMTCKRLAWGVQASFRLHNKPVNALWNFSKVPDVKVTATALLPSTSIIGFTLGNGLSFITFVNTVPINANKTINRFCLIRSLAADQATMFAKLNPFFNWSGFDVFARKAMIKILSEDKAMVEQLRPQLVLHEAGVRADIPQQRFRALRQEYIDLGYGVDPQAPEERVRIDF